jgi:chromosome segregation ATPase
MRRGTIDRGWLCPPETENASTMQSVLFFVLGFLSAGFIALIIAPAVWRRAAFLTRKRIEASVPLTLAEIQADKDRMRAEFAMATRRLEINFKTFREKAAAQIVEINRNREELKQLMSERSERHEALTRLEAEAGEVRAELRKREDQLQVFAEQLAQAEQTLEQRAEEIEKLGRMYDEATFTASNRQLELVAREGEIEKLSADMATLRSERREIDRRNKEVSTESRTARESLKTEQERAIALEARIERLLATIADREETLDRREREMTRLRESLKTSSTTEEGMNAQLAAAQAEMQKLEADHAELKVQMSTYLSGAKNKEMEKAMAKVSADRDLLEERLRLLARENRKLKVDIAVHERTKSEEWSGERRASAMLREQMSDLAAEVVRLTAVLDGPDSPISKSIGASAARGGGHDNGEKITSLADRVRALQKAAASG